MKNEVPQTSGTSAVTQNIGVIRNYYINLISTDVCLDSLPLPMRGKVSRTVEDLLTFRTPVFHVYDHRAPGDRDSVSTATA